MDRRLVAARRWSPESREAMVTVMKAAPVARLKAKAKVGHALIGRVATDDATVPLSLNIKLY